eukprot:TRINITY_DN2611_c0_g1_i1.p1 TRINITY_DN2611_c0_g1~~TRINITY_DN2611_c0_g1_i1.p1  ORF type:complete len:617 (-),score=122.87 TRINITY_DN2611_c0_g1_i1:104-1954(-)
MNSGAVTPMNATALLEYIRSNRDHLKRSARLHFFSAYPDELSELPTELDIMSLINTDPVTATGWFGNQTLPLGPLHLAALFDNKAVFLFLLDPKWRADLSRKCWNGTTGAESTPNQTILDYAKFAPDGGAFVKAALEEFEQKRQVPTLPDDVSVPTVLVPYFQPALTSRIERLILAVTEGHLNTVATLFKPNIKAPKYLGPPARTVIGQEVPLISIAAHRGHKSVVDYLLQKDASNLGSDSENKTPMHYAVMSNSSKLIYETLCRAMKHQRWSITQTDSNGMNLLHHAAKSNPNPDIISWLCKEIDPMVPDTDGCLPLHFAAEHNSKTICQILIDRQSAAVNVTDKSGETPIFAACNSSNSDVIRLLLENGANTKILAASTGVCLFHKFRTVPEDTVFQLLHDRGTPVNTQDKRDGNTPLHRACVNNRAPVVLALLKIGANPDLQNKRKQTSADVAKEKGKPEIIAAIEKHRSSHAESSGPDSAVALPPVAEIPTTIPVISVAAAAEEEPRVLGKAKAHAAGLEDPIPLSPKKAKIEDTRLSLDPEEQYAKLKLLTAEQVTALFVEWGFDDAAAMIQLKKVNGRKMVLYLSDTEALAELVKDPTELKLVQKAFMKL